MRRSISVLAMVLILLPALGAFGSAEAESDVTTTGPVELVIFSHSVHQQVAEGAKGAMINVAAEFEEQYDAQLQWNPIAWAQMQDKVLREISAPDGQADLIFLLDGWASRSVLGMFEPLDPSVVATGSSIPEGMLNHFTLDNELRLVPYRTNQQMLHFNTQLVEERGVTPPTTIYELGEAAKQLSFQRADGGQVYGLGYIPSQTFFEVIFAFGGDVLDKELNIHCNEPEAVEAIAFLRDLYVAGAIPKNFTEMDAASNNQLYTNGLMGFILMGDNYYLKFNDSEKSLIAGNSGFMALPDRNGNPAPAKLAFWAAGVPKNASPENRQKAEEFLRFFSSMEAQTSMALNGNGPVQSAVYDNPEFAENVAYAEVARKVLPYGRTLLPPIESAAQVTDIMSEEVTNAILGDKDPQAAMDDAADRILSVLVRDGLK